MKNLFIASFVFAFLFFSCKPEKSPEPNSIETVSTLNIELEKISFEIGSSFTPRANLIQNLDTTKNVAAVWLISVDSIANLDGNNLISLKKIGSFQLIAQFSGFSDTVNIQVIEASNLAKSISLTLTKSEISIHESIQLDLKILDENSKELELTNTTWEINDTNLFSISETGLLSPKNFGETQISVESNGLKSTEKNISIYREGTFSGKEGHSASGDVILVSRNGQLFIETRDNLNVEGGPDLRMYLSNVEFGSNVNTSGLELSLLKSNTGKATYAVPKEVKIADYQFIIIQCKQYKVTFGSAKLN